MPSTAMIWGVIAKIANKMADLSPLFYSLYFKGFTQNGNLKSHVATMHEGKKPFQLEWVKEWWQVSHFVCNFCDYSPYYCSRWHQLAWNFDRYFLFQKLVPFSSLILTYSIRILKILNIKHNLLVKYPQNISICGEYSQA